MFVYYALGMFGSPGIKWSSVSYKKPKQKDIVQRIGIGIASVPGMTMGALTLVIGGIGYAGKTVVKVAAHVVTRPFYLVSSLLKKKDNKQITQEMKQHILTESEIQKFNKMAREEIEQDPETIYLVVKQSNIAKDKIISSLVIALDPEDTVDMVLTLCRRKWSIKQMENIQLFNNNCLIKMGASFKDLKRNHLGVVEILLVRMEVFG